ncbi:MAG: 50S ribosomal protein L3 [Deltaproteobacteria bacterium]|nr:50S ribosomal protein L3 [Deltaproteobacteria bacterium]
MGLLGKKVGMTQIFEDGERIPVTVLEVGPCYVIQKKTSDGKDGYGAIQLGFEDYGRITKRTKVMPGHFKRSDIKPKRFLREIRIDDPEKLAAFEIGQELKANVFEAGQLVDITGTSKGKGFQGVMRRHNMKGSKQATHGTHENFRHVGSIGCRTTPGEVHKGKRLPGHMGAERVTTQNVKIVRVDAEKNLVLVHGSVPGAPDGFVMIRHAVKKGGTKA